MKKKIKFKKFHIVFGDTVPSDCERGTMNITDTNIIIRKWKFTKMKYEKKPLNHALNYEVHTSVRVINDHDHWILSDFKLNEVQTIWTWSHISIQ